MLWLANLLVRSLACSKAIDSPLTLTSQPPNANSATHGTSGTSRQQVVSSSALPLLPFPFAFAFGRCCLVGLRRCSLSLLRTACVFIDQDVDNCHAKEDVEAVGDVLNLYGVSSAVLPVGVKHLPNAVERLHHIGKLRPIANSGDK